MPDRILKSNSSKVIVNGLPKSGTNLIQRLVELCGLKYADLGLASSLLFGNNYLLRQLIRGALLDRNPIEVGFEAPIAINSSWLNRKLRQLPEQFYISAHLNYSERLHYYFQKHSIKTLHIVRDPRAVLKSNIEFFKQKKDYYLNQCYRGKSNEEILSFILSGGYDKNVGIYFNSFSDCLQRASAWQGRENVLCVKFESLVGAQGGGSKSLQLQTIHDIVDFLEIDIDHSNQKQIAANLFGHTHTFRGGKINSWEDYFSSESIQKIEHACADFMRIWGYLPLLADSKFS
jgi:hypothetical protein